MQLKNVCFKRMFMNFFVLMHCHSQSLLADVSVNSQTVMTKKTTEPEAALLSNSCPSGLFENLHVSGEAVLQLGGFTTTQGKSQHVDIEGLIGDTFKVKKSTAQNLLVGAGYYLHGFDVDMGSCGRADASFLYGINAFYLLPTQVKGVVVQEDLFTNLSYKYSRANYPIYLATKALIHFGACQELTIDLGIGPNIVATSGFKEKSLDDGITLPDHIFTGKTTVVFSATAGLGWRLHHLFGNFSLEINYRFFYLGEGELKKVNNQIENRLRTGNSYGNSLFVSISI